MVAREQVMAKIVTRLEGITDPTGLTVTRNDELDFDKWPYALVLDGGHEVDIDHAVDIDRIIMELTVVIGVSPNHKTNLGTALNELHRSVVVALTSDPTLDGIGDIAEVSMGTPELGDEDGHGHMAVAVLEFRADYEQPRGDPNTIITI